jgi:enoyl-CoA hydratase/carnithine racemase
MNETKIRLETSDFLATITLNRPQKLNALDPEMLLQLEEAANQIEKNRETRVVLLTGAGEKAFCVGADINAWSALQPLDMWRSWVRDGHRVFDRIANLRQPVIAVLNGYAFGGGLELALAADLRLAAENAELAMPEVKIATAPGWAGSQRLPALIGAARAKQMIFTGRRITARQAEQWGLVNEVFPAKTLMAEALALAKEIAENAPVSVQITKQLINSATGQNAGMSLEALAGALAAQTEDGREGIASFREKRAAQYKGK